MLKWRNEIYERRKQGSLKLIIVFFNFNFSTGKSKKKEKCKNSHLYPLIETQYCPCDKYNAQPVGNWSDCILPEGKAEVLLGMKVQGDIKECGQGYRYQAMACYDQNGRLVETSRCNSHGNPFFFFRCYMLAILGVQVKCTCPITEGNVLNWTS